MFGDLVRGHRRRLALTQEELAVKAGMNARTVGKVESGQIASPRPATVRLLADAFALDGVDRERFFRAAVEEAEAGQPATPGPAPRVQPAQLPADIPTFIGRASQLDQLTATLDRAGPTNQAALITAIGGTAGVGKTALAVHWARRVRDRFPDGQLYLNLRGYDPDRPMPPADALAALLRALGVPAADVPVELEERASVYRSTLDGRRILVLLDNASSVEQVRPLLPGSPSCFAVVTSRDSLGGLIARHGAYRIELDLLPRPDALDLLRSMLGSRVDDELAAADTLAERCARLPLALRVVAELAAARPESPLSTLVAELADQERRLALLDAGGDTRTAIRAVFSWSYDNLPADVVAMHRRLGLHPGTDWDVYAAAVLANVAPEQARGLLDRLVRAHLIHRTGPEHYGMHDLLRTYAATAVSHVDNDAAVTRLFEHYVATSAVAVEVLSVAAAPPPVPAGASAGPGFGDRDAAVAWLERELPTLVAVSDYAVSHRPSIAVHLSAVLGRFLLSRAHYLEGRSIHQSAVDAARSLDDWAGQARALALLGTAYGQRGRHAEAEEHLLAAVEIGLDDQPTRALALRSLALVRWHLGQHGSALELADQAVDASRACGDDFGLAIMLGNRGSMLWRAGRSAHALRDLTESVAVFDARPSPYGMAQALNSMAELHRRQGRYAQSEHFVHRAMTTARAGHDKTGEAIAVRELGSLHLGRGRYDIAADYLSEAITMLDLTYPYGAAYARCRLGETRHRQGRYPEAVLALDRALAYFRQSKDPAGEGEALTRLGLVRHALSEYDPAREHLIASLELARRNGIRYEEAAAHAGLGLVYATTDEPDRALHHRRQALIIYDELDVPEAGELRILLAATEASA